MMTEGFRWHGIAGWEFSLSGGQAGNMHFNSQKPVALFCRQWNWTFGGGSDVPRTLKLFNDTRLRRPHRGGLGIEARRPAGCRREADVRPGRVRTPGVRHYGEGPARFRGARPGEFILTCTRGGKEVFREVKPVAVLDPNGGPRPSLRQGRPGRARSAGLGQEPLAGPRHRLHGGRLRGRDPRHGQGRGRRQGRPHAPAKPPIRKWTALAGNGAQGAGPRPGPSAALPGDPLGPCAHRLRRPRGLRGEHRAPDLLRPGAERLLHLVEGPRRLPQRLHETDPRGDLPGPLRQGVRATRPSPSARSTTACSCSARWSWARSWPSTRWPQRLFDNMLAYCARYVPVRRETAVVMAEGSPALKLLRDSGLKFDLAADVLSARRRRQAPGRGLRRHAGGAANRWPAISIRCGPLRKRAAGSWPGA